MWVGEALRRIWDIHTDPAESVPDDTSPGELDAWIEGLLAANGITSRVYVASHLGILPWLECRVPGHGWTARLRDTIEQPWVFLSGTLDSLVVVSEAEYTFEACLSRRPA